MFTRCKSMEWASLITAHACTVALAVSFNCSWQVPLDGFRYGGLTYGLALTVAMVIVALPLMLLQLAVGQLCQQDVVAMWRAVPFFKGAGYLRLLISFVGSVYTVIYLGVVITCFFYTIRNFLPLWDCEDLLISSDNFETIQLNSTLCVNSTIMIVPPITEEPEHYVSVALMMTVLWISCPFLLYTPVKMMRIVFYVCTPIVLILAITVLSYGGVVNDISWFYTSDDWQHFLEPHIWHRALTQAMWTSQMAGGYLVVTSDTVYEKTNVKWSTLIIIGVNIVFNWAGLLFWFSISGSYVRNGNEFRLISIIYNVAQEKSPSIAWPLIAFTMIFFSGAISLNCRSSVGHRILFARLRWVCLVCGTVGVVVMSCGPPGNGIAVSLLPILLYIRGYWWGAYECVQWPLNVYEFCLPLGYRHEFIYKVSLLLPLYERFRVVGGRRWRVISVSCSLVGLGAGLAALAGGAQLLHALHATATPLLVSVATLIETCAFIFIYGWKVLVKDVEFLTGQDLAKWWVMGWCAAPGVVLPLTLWWGCTVLIKDSSWLNPPWDACSFIAAALVIFAVLTVGATFAVQSQVQYDYTSKLYSSFKPSRDWGPRDPITHYYWMSRRHHDWTRPRTLYRRQLGQFSGHTSSIHLPKTPQPTKLTHDTDKRRANSDDWIYTVHRRKYLKRAHKQNKKLRSISVDWSILPKSQKSLGSASNLMSASSCITPEQSLRSVQEDSYKDFFGLDVDLMLLNNNNISK